MNVVDKDLFKRMVYGMLSNGAALTELTFTTIKFNIKKDGYFHDRKMMNDISEKFAKRFSLKMDFTVI